MLPIFKDYRKMLLDNGLDLSEYDEDKLWVDKLIVKGFDKKGNIKGIFAIDIDLNSLSEILTSLNFGFNNETFLLNSDGKVIAHSMVNELSLDMQGTELLNQIEKSNKNYYIDTNKDAYVFVKDSSNNWILVTRIPREILTQFKIDKEFINLILFIYLI